MGKEDNRRRQKTVVVMENSGYIVRGTTVEKELRAVSLGEYFFQRLGEHGDRVAQVQEVDGQVVSHSFTDLLRMGKNITVFMRDNSLKSGDTILLCCFNTLEFAPLLLGTLFLGGTLAPINPRFDTSDMLHLLEVIQPSLVICNSTSEAAMTAAITKSGKDIPWISIDVIVQIMNSKQDVKIDLGPVDPTNDVAFVMCSSGTSGKPKGVEIVHSRFYPLIQKNIFSIVEAHRGKGVALNMAGPNWVSCLLVTLTMLVSGNQLVLLNGFTVESFLLTIQTFKINWVVIGPDQVVALAKFPNLHEYDTMSLTSVLVGGAATPDHSYKDLQRKLRGCMTQIYGMTESMGIARPDFQVRDKFGNVGKLMENCYAKVLDINTGELLGRNCEGELCFRTPTMMKGYRNNPAETSAAIDDEGFLHTGDVGYFDEDGFLFIKDRIKDLIKYRRDHVPPIDIEEVLVAHPAIKEVAVVGVFHEEDWERATGVVVLRPGASATAEELLQLVQDKLPSFKWLHGGLKFVDTLPRTSSGKIQRKAIRDMLTQ